MIRLSDNVWIGDSDDEKSATTLAAGGITAILNVAQDMNAWRGWGVGLEVMHVGLIDGPGNEQAAYCAAILALHILLRRERVVLVCCHDGGRAAAVAAMYAILRAGRRADRPSAPNRWPAWAAAIAGLRKACGGLPTIHPAHADAYERLPLTLLETLL